MKNIPGFQPKNRVSMPLRHCVYTHIFAFWLILILLCQACTDSTPMDQPEMSYAIAFHAPQSHDFQVKLQTSGWEEDTIVLKMPQWMPGYYQIMNYARDVSGFKVGDQAGSDIEVSQLADNAWQLTGVSGKNLEIAYTVSTSKQFVANSYVDSAHAYIIPAAAFFYVEGKLHLPVSVKIEMHDAWDRVATGLKSVADDETKLIAPDFDILYDSPILVGKLEELPSFKVKGVEHRFIGYKLGEFDRMGFIQKLQKMAAAAVDIIGDIPFDQYTFIAIGPGRGGIEHLNNTTVSFDGNQLQSDEEINTVMNFLAHEYFHHYNVKRIRPMELGAFNYDRGSKTNLLWVSEGLSVYYEYLIVKRAGLIDVQTLLEDFENNINTYENNPGKAYQSLVQASFDTWQDGPFGAQGEEAGKTISYYQKGPVVGLLMDFAIRHATENKRSLDHVMQYLYQEYYQKEGRGFTDAEFRQASENIAGTSLASLFEYVYTTKPLDYQKYLEMGGLRLEKNPSDVDSEKKVFTLKQIEHPTELQQTIFNTWAGVE